VIFSSTILRAAVLFAMGISATMPLASLLWPAQSGATNQETQPVPWTSAQVIHPADLVHELGASEKAGASVIVYVGFRTLFEGGHIPHAVFHGTASKADGLADLRKWATPLPRSTNLTIYCGCCPFDRCPNIRPAYSALHEMGFTHLRVLMLPASFAADWVEKGYPMQKGL